MDCDLEWSLRKANGSDKSVCSLASAPETGIQLQHADRQATEARSSCCSLVRKVSILPATGGRVAAWQLRRVLRILQPTCTNSTPNLLSGRALQRFWLVTPVAAISEKRGPATPPRKRKSTTWDSIQPHAMDAAIRSDAVARARERTAAVSCVAIGRALRHQVPSGHWQ